MPPDIIHDRITKIVGDCFSKPDQDSIVLPNWPFDDTYCFAWPYPHGFALPDDVRKVLSISLNCSNWKQHFRQAKQLPADWKIPPEIAASLYKKYETPFPAQQRDKLGLRRLEYLPGGNNVYVQIHPLTSHTLQTSEGSLANWTDEKGWYDDLVKLSRKLWISEGCLWVSDSAPSGHKLPNSFIGNTEWDNCQEERDGSLTLEESFTEPKSEIFKFQLIVE